MLIFEQTKLGKVVTAGEQPLIRFRGIDTVAKLTFCCSFCPAVTVIEIALGDGELLQEFLQFLCYGVDALAVGDIVSVALIAHVAFHAHNIATRVAALDKELVVLFVV